MKLPVPLLFDWDKGNIAKSEVKHRVTAKETEEVFFNQPLKTYRDKIHSEKESRFVALGITDSKRKLFIIFIVRKAKVRVVSARDQSRKERKLYGR